MSDELPIWVPSKGRPNSTTARLLEEAGLPFLIVVEPQDGKTYPDYRHGKKIVLPKNNQGLPFVRNFIIQSADGKYWMMDDDISGFTFEGKKITAVDAIRQAEKILSELKIGQGAMEYAQFAWSAKKAVRWNSYCDVCVFMDSKVAKQFQYQADVELKEDRDFTLRVLSAGYQTARAAQYGFVCPKMGTNVGGLQKKYEEEGELERRISRMIELWGDGICRRKIRKDGTPDVEINWKFFSAKKRLRHARPSGDSGK